MFPVRLSGPEVYRGIISNGWGYELLPLIGQSERTDLLTPKFICLWSWHKPNHSPSSLGEWYHWLYSVNISSAYHTLCLNVAALCSFKVFQPGFLVRQAQELYSEMGQAVTQFPGFGGVRPGPRSRKSIVWGPESGRPVPQLVPWLGCTTILSLQMNVTGSWDFYLGTADRNLVC